MYEQRRHGQGAYQREEQWEHRGHHFISMEGSQTRIWNSNSPVLWLSPDECIHHDFDCRPIGCASRIWTRRLEGCFGGFRKSVCLIYSTLPGNYMVIKFIVFWKTRLLQGHRPFLFHFVIPTEISTNVWVRIIAQSHAVARRSPVVLSNDALLGLPVKQDCDSLMRLSRKASLGLRSTAPTNSSKLGLLVSGRMRLWLFHTDVG